MISEYKLRVPTSHSWTEIVIQEFNTFLIDHALCEKKAAGMAVAMLSQFPEKRELVTAMSDLAVEEMMHFREVIKLIHQRGLELTKDEKDPYIARLRQHTSTHQNLFLLDRLLMGSVVEARGAERFQLVADNLDKTEKNLQLQKFYKAIAQSESRHYVLFLELAYQYYSEEQVDQRLDEWLNIEAEVINTLAITPKLH